MSMHIKVTFRVRDVEGSADISNAGLPSEIYKIIAEVAEKVSHLVKPPIITRMTLTDSVQEIEEDRKKS